MQHAKTWQGKVENLCNSLLNKSNIELQSSHNENSRSDNFSIELVYISKEEIILILNKLPESENEKHHDPNCWGQHNFLAKSKEDIKGRETSDQFSSS